MLEIITFKKFILQIFCGLGRLNFESPDFKLMKVLPMRRNGLSKIKKIKGELCRFCCLSFSIWGDVGCSNGWWYRNMKKICQDLMQAAFITEMWENWSTKCMGHWYLQNQFRGGIKIRMFSHGYGHKYNRPHTLTRTQFEKINLHYEFMREHMTSHHT